MTGKIPEKSYRIVKRILKFNSPVAVSPDFIRMTGGMSKKSAEKICMEIGAERVETSNGVYYRWAEK